MLVNLKRTFTKPSTYEWTDLIVKINEYPFNNPARLYTSTGLTLSENGVTSLPSDGTLDVWVKPGTLFQIDLALASNRAFVFSSEVNADPAGMGGGGLSASDSLKLATLWNAAWTGGTVMPGTIGFTIEPSETTDIFINTWVLDQPPYDVNVLGSRIDWGDGTIDLLGDFRETRVGHTYAENGNFNITVQARNANTSALGAGLTKPVTVGVPVEPTQVEAEFFILVSPLTFLFVPEALNSDSAALLGATLDWGDGTSVTIPEDADQGQLFQYLQHAYAADGVYPFVYTQLDGGTFSNDFNTEDPNLDDINNPHTGSVFIQNSVYENSTFKAQVYAADPPWVGPFTYTWTVDNDDTVLATGPDPFFYHVFNDTNPHRVRCAVEDSTGFTKKLSYAVTPIAATWENTSATLLRMSGVTQAFQLSDFEFIPTGGFGNFGQVTVKAGTKIGTLAMEFADADVPPPGYPAPTNMALSLTNGGSNARISFGTDLSAVNNLQFRTYVNSENNSNAPWGTRSGSLNPFSIGYMPNCVEGGTFALTNTYLELGFVLGDVVLAEDVTVSNFVQSGVFLVADINNPTQTDINNINTQSKLYTGIEMDEGKGVGKPYHFPYEMSFETTILVNPV